MCIPDMEAQTLVQVLHDTLAKDRGRKIRNTPGEVKTKALLDTLAYILA